MKNISIWLVRTDVRRQGEYFLISSWFQIKRETPLDANRTKSWLYYAPTPQPAMPWLIINGHMAIRGRFQIVRLPFLFVQAEHEYYGAVNWAGSFKISINPILFRSRLCLSVQQLKLSHYYIIFEVNDITYMFIYKVPGKLGFMSLYTIPRCCSPAGLLVSRTNFGG